MCALRREPKIGGEVSPPCTNPDQKPPLTCASLEAAKVKHAFGCAKIPGGYRGLLQKVHRGQLRHGIKPRRPVRWGGLHLAPSSERGAPHKGMPPTKMRRQWSPSKTLG